MSVSKGQRPMNVKLCQAVSVLVRAVGEAEAETVLTPQLRSDRDRR